MAALGHDDVVEKWDADEPACFTQGMRNDAVCTRRINCAGRVKVAMFETATFGPCEPSLFRTNARALVATKSNARIRGAQQ